MPTILIIGGGASGVLMAAHLLRHCPSASVVLAERQRRIGAGVAYATDNPLHLLNVRAGNMSAFGDEPKHFARWLLAGWVGGIGELDCSQSFAPRLLYQQYLRHVLEGAVRSAPAGTLTTVTAEIVDLAETPEAVVATTATGQVFRSDIAILATGNEAAARANCGKLLDGWSRLPTLARDASILMVGTGLTMVDHVAALVHGDHRGPVMAVSPHGRLPEAHRRVAAHAIAEDELPGEVRLPILLKWLRERVRQSAAQGGDWRSTLDGLRPHTQALWMKLAPADRHRFLRHCASLWNTHRHRMPQEIAERVRDARAKGLLTIVRGRVLAVDTSERGVRTTIALAGRPGEHRVVAHDVLIDCRGSRPDIRQTHNTLLRNVMSSALGRPDALALGLDVTADMELIAATGHASERIYTLGPMTTGTFWECTAVPDIRDQACRIARRIARHARASGAGIRKVS